MTNPHEHERYPAETSAPPLTLASPPPVPPVPPVWAPVTPPRVPPAPPWGMSTPPQTELASPWPGAAPPPHVAWSEPATPFLSTGVSLGTESPLARALAIAAAQLVPATATAGPPPPPLLRMPGAAGGMVAFPQPKALEGQQQRSGTASAACDPAALPPGDAAELRFSAVTALATAASRDPVAGPGRRRSHVSETELLYARYRRRRAAVTAAAAAADIGRGREARAARINLHEELLKETGIPARQSNAFVDADVMRFLQAIGFSQYSELFTRKRVAGEMLHTLSNVELRDDLGIKCLRHRREILRAIALYQTQDKQRTLVPEFGRILLHLSNVRNFHSWISLGFQHIAFSIVVVRLSTFRKTTSVVHACSYMAVFGIASIFYGALRYWIVQRIIEREARKDVKAFSADVAGTLSAAAGALVTSAFVFYLIFADASQAYLNND
jgi:uncharacterized membrane protein YidH (DUF202 family)